jgi:hypothetical protein
VNKPILFHSVCCFVGLLSLAVSPVFFQSEGSGPKGTIYQINVPKQGQLVGNPAYFCWIPDSVKTFRCIISHQHGCTRERDARQMMYDVQWTTLAKKWNAVFMACSLTADQAHCPTWDQQQNGSGNAYLAALDSLAARLKHPEIKTIPWAFWGHSGGAFWVTGMMGVYPERVAVSVVQSCGYDISNVAAALKIPTLHHNGRKDGCYNDPLFANGRAKGALWAHAINPFPMWVNGGICPTSTNPRNLCWDTIIYGHAPHDMRMIAIPWIDICLAARLPTQAGSAQINDMDTTNVWLGDTGTRAIASAATFTGNKLKACWFPNQYCATKWKEYMATGTLKDSTPPPAPYNLTGAYSNRQIVLKWDADADLETGIKTFVIYRNGSLLQTIQWPSAPTTLFTAEKGYQRWDDGDQPNPFPAPAMTFTDNNLSDTGTYTYEVGTVNWSNTTGPKSGTLTLKRGQVTGVTTISTFNATASRKSISLCNTIGNRTLALSPGVIDLYDISGRFLKTVEIKRAVIVSMDALLGGSSEKVLIVRNRVR